MKLECDLPVLPITTTDFRAIPKQHEDQYSIIKDEYFTHYINNNVQEINLEHLNEGHIEEGRIALDLPTNLSLQEKARYYQVAKKDPKKDVYEDELTIKVNLRLTDYFEEDADFFYGIEYTPLQSKGDNRLRIKQYNAQSFNFGEEACPIYRTNNDDNLVKELYCGLYKTNNPDFVEIKEEWEDYNFQLFGQPKFIQNRLHIKAKKEGIVFFLFSYEYEWGEREFVFIHVDHWTGEILGVYRINDFY